MHQTDSMISPPCNASTDRLWRLISQAAAAPGMLRQVAVANRALLQWRIETIGDALAGLLRRDVTTRWTSPRQPVRQAFAVLIRVPESSDVAVGIADPVGSPRPAGRRIVIGLDSALGRAIVDAITSDLAGLRGQGSLLEPEFGLLEYAALMAIDRVHAAGGADFSVERFMSGRELAADRLLCPGEPVYLSTSIAAHKGTLTIWGDLDCEAIQTNVEHVTSAAAIPVSRANEAGASERGDSSSTIHLEAALPSMTLCQEELRSLRPGDVVLSSVTDLSACLLTLRTDTGWHLGHATVARLRPTLISLHADTLSPTPQPDHASNSERLTAHITFGRMALSRRQFSALAHRLDSAPLDLPLDMQDPARLYAEGRLIAIGELLDADGQTAFRVCSCRQQD